MKPNLNLKYTLLKKQLEKEYYYFNILPKLKNMILALGKTLSPNEYRHIKNDIWIHKTAKVDKSTKLIGPLIIGENSEIRFSSFIRGSVLIGKNVVIGNSVEIKNSILFDEVKIPHLSYVGDSILGYKVHIGAGTIISNVRLDKNKVKVGDYQTNLNKLGSIVGQNVEIGCSCVINPGTIIHENSKIIPLSNVRGIIKEKDKCVE